MSEWHLFPVDYRKKEVERIVQAVRAGESTALIGLSGAGKSNLLGFLANRWPFSDEKADVRCYLLDCNSLPQADAPTLLQALTMGLGGAVGGAENEYEGLKTHIGSLFKTGEQKLCLMLDRYEIIEQTDPVTASNNLRALRDVYKYQLSFLLASRYPLNHESELAELFYANTLYLGPLSQTDTEWNITRFARFRNEEWESEVVDRLSELSWGYPSLLRGYCEAYAALKTLDRDQLTKHPAVLNRVREFLSDGPNRDILEYVGMAGHPLLSTPLVHQFDTSQLTAKELALLNYFQDHPNQVCTKDALVLNVWPEDQVYEAGIRDDSLAQLVRRLRVKIEPDPSNPQFIHTIPGRGYRYSKTPKDQ